MEPVEPFEPFRESGHESAGAASSCNSTNRSGDSSQVHNGFSLIQSSATTSAFFSSLSPPCSVGTSGEDGGTTGKLNENIAASEDKKGNTETVGTPHRDIGSAGSSAVLRGSQQFIGGFRGGKGMGGRPFPASRLSLVDKKWLERCQVFGEMGAEERPGAGNKVIDVEKRRAEEERGREAEGKETQVDKRVGNEKIEQDGERNRAVHLGRDERFKSIAIDKIGSDTVPTQQRTRKGKGGREEKEKKSGGEEMERGLTPPPTPEDDGQTSPKSKGTKKRGRKRLREEEDMEGDTTEEGGVKKKRRNGKKKEESCDVNGSPTQESGKKRRAKKKGDENGEGEEEKKTKAPKRVRSIIYVSLNK